MRSTPLRCLHPQLERLRDGTLLVAPDTLIERVEHLDERIAELTKRRDQAQAALDAYLQQAQAALDADVIVTR